MRLPALYNGIFAHKPTSGIVSLKGNVPTCEDERFSLWFTNGIMGRYAEDLPIMLSSVVKPELKTNLKLLEPVRKYFKNSAYKVNL